MFKVSDTSSFSFDDYFTIDGLEIDHKNNKVIGIAQARSEYGDIDYTPSVAGRRTIALFYINVGGIAPNISSFCWVNTGGLGLKLQL